MVGKQLPVLLFGMNVDILNHLQEDLGWIGAMTLENNRDNADVRIYCGEWGPQHLLPCQ